MDNYIDEFVDINHAFVHVRQYGFSETLLPPQKDCTTYTPKIIQRLDPTLVVIVTPGNPGIVGTYHDFIHQLRTASAAHSNNNPLPVIIMSHNNFDHPINGDINAVHTIRDSTKATKNSNYDPNQVELQIRNKIVLIKKMLDLRKTKVILIGHSVGCYITLRMMNDDEELRSAIAGACLIHPTIENIGSSPNGKYWTQVFSYKADWVFSMCSFVLSSVVPTALKKYLAQRRYGVTFQQLSSTVQEGLVQVFDFKPLRAMVGMAKSEFKYIKDLDIEELKKFSDRLRFIYAKKDLWVSEEHKQKILKCPELKAIERDFPHAFVLDPKGTKHYANLLADYFDEFTSK